MPSHSFSVSLVTTSSEPSSILDADVLGRDAERYVVTKRVMKNLKERFYELS
jgi:hypothetical protein